MIEGCKHGPTNLVQQPCADCETERLSATRATHALSERLSAVARLGGAEDENAPANPLPHVWTVGDLGAHPAAETLVRALNAHEGDYQKQIEIADTALRAGAEAPSSTSDEQHLINVYRQNKCGDADCEGRRFAAAQTVLKGWITHADAADALSAEAHARSLAEPATETIKRSAGAEALATDFTAWLVKDLESRRDAMWDKSRSPATMEEQLAFARASEIDTIIAFIPLLAAQGKSGASALAPSPDKALKGLEKINEIRNSIVGFQHINWSEHIYPLVAALDEAGMQGMPYPEAREYYGTMLERTKAAELRAEALAPPAPGWQPITSAPKDGSAFLAFGIHDHSPPDAARGVKAGDYWWAIVLWDVWQSSNIFVFAKDGKGTWSYPTHWQPLPAPPRADARDRKD